MLLATPKHSPSRLTEWPVRAHPTLPLQAQTQRAEMLRLRRDELAAEVDEAAAAVAQEEAEQAELRRQVQVRMGSLSARMGCM